MEPALAAGARIVVVIPTYNERANIGRLLDELIRILPPDRNRADFLVVDDDSPDGTAAVVLERAGRDPRIHLLAGRRAGLGAAYVRGLRHALDRFNPEVVFQMDADLSHSPRDVPRLLAALEAGADLAIGSRLIDGNRTPREWGWWRRAISWGGNLVARHWLRLAPVRDCTAGFRAWRAGLLREIQPESVLVQGYAFQVAVLSRALAQHARVVEVPVEFADRVQGESKLGWADLIEFIGWAIFHGGRRRGGS